MISSYPEGEAVKESALDRRRGGLLVLARGLGCRDNVHAVGVEDEGFDFRFGAFGGDFFAVPEESHSGGVADLGDDFVVGANGGVSGGDQGFMADGLSVGEDGDPGSFCGADDEGEARRS